MDRTGWIPVVFTPAEIEDMRLVASERERAKRSDRHNTNQNRTNAHLQGYAAECALAKLLGVKPDRTVLSGGSRGVHLRAHGLSFNVVITPSEDYDLRYMERKYGLPMVDVMVLAVGDIGESPVIWLRGCISSKLFKQTSLRRDFGYGFRVYVPAAQLSRMTFLAAYLGVEHTARQLRHAYEEHRSEYERQRGFMFTEEMLDGRG